MIALTEDGCQRCQWMLALVVICTAALPATAQENARRLRELEAEIRDVEREQTRRQQRQSVAARRLALLREALKLRKEMASLEARMEAAERAKDERTLAMLEERLEGQEQGLEVVGIRLEIAEQRGELLEIMHDLEEEEKLRQEAQSLLGMLDQGVRLAAALDRAFRADEEEAVEEIAETFGEIEEKFERRRQILQLKVELHYAREEEEEELIRELEAELREVSGEQPGAEPAQQTVSTTYPAAIQLSDAEIQAAAKLNFETDVIPLMKAACFECHDHEAASGDLDLEALVATRPLVVNRSDWMNVMQQLKVRSMPPAEAEQPVEADRRRMLASLTHAIERFDYATVRQPGYEPARRLTHEEYNNTVRDLVGMDLRPADRFPRDLTASSGFDNSANSLVIQPVTLERYVNAAESIVHTAWPREPVSSEQRAARQQLLGAVTDLHAEGASEDVLRRFAMRAYRRPVAKEELLALQTYYHRQRGNGISAEDALREVLQAILVSPNFLMRTEAKPPQPGKPQRTSDWELANRLSYFLWASMPDDELFQLAADRRLSESSVLTAQVDRMLEDDKAATLGHLFAGQWLRFADLDRVQRDQIDNPWATDSLVAAMGQESAMLFNSLVDQNQPIDRLLDADYTFVNEELARHYRLRGVRGTHMRRVELRENPRRGILGHASILAVTSFPGRTSPTVRGDWILTHLLGTPPPPPPPNVSEFDDRVAENERLSQRQKLELHRSNPNCYACHSQIDPLGFALEKFEWFGRYRPERRGKPVDAAGRLPGGGEFVGLAGLADALLADRVDDLTSQFVRKLLSYALGRQLEYYDEATVRELASTLQDNDRRVRTLIHAIVASDTFQMQQLPAK